MLLLDTNVVSELMKARPEGHVMTWAGRQRSGDLCTSALTVGEIYAGLEALPEGRRRTELENAAHRVFAAFGARVLPLDQRTARHYGTLHARAKAAGYTVGTIDVQIAAIAELHGARVVTRNTSDFAPTGVATINPWEAGDR